MHDLWRTAASLLLAYSGAGLARLQFVPGHSQFVHTVGLHGHFVPGRFEQLKATFVARQRRAAGTNPAGIDLAGTGGGALPSAPAT